MTEQTRAIQLVEAAYRDLDQPVDGWLSRVRETALRTFDNDYGTVGEIEVSANGDARVLGVAADERAIAIHQRVLAEVDVPHDGSLASMMTAVYRMMPVATRRALFLTGPFSRLSVSIGAHPPKWLRARPDFPDCHNAIGLDPSGRGFALALPAHPRCRRPSARSLSYVAAHLAAVHRLRRSPTKIEAVVDRGKLVHAEGHARDAPSRQALIEAASRIDRARARREPRGMELWTALVEGRWSLVEQFDRDGRRLFVARRNEPQARVGCRLTDAEGRVVALYAIGHAQKMIAYELGMTESSVSSRLRSALRKLRVSGRTALVELHGALTAHG